MHTGNEPTNRMSTYQLDSFFSRMADELECPFFLAFARRQKCKCQMAPKYEECQIGQFGSNNQPVATDNTTGNEAGRAVSSMALTISHLQWREGREGEETDQMDLERMKNWFCQPNEPTAFLPSSLAPPCIGVSGCLTDCDGQCNGCPSILRRSERRATMFPRSALSVKIN